MSVSGQIHHEFLCLLWVLADKQTRDYCALIGAEELIGCEASTCSQARMFSFNKNSIDKGIAYATATRLHISVHSTAPLSCRHPGQPISSTECLMHSAAHALHGAANASHYAAPHPAPSCPAVNVDVGAPNVAPSDHANRAGASEEVDVIDDASHTASGVAASK